LEQAQGFLTYVQIALLLPRESFDRLIRKLLGHERQSGLWMRSARLADEQGHSGVPMQEHCVVWMQGHCVVSMQGGVKQTPEHQRMNVVQRPQKAE
jgi:hypothetical protein